jgi:hypothetical protein
MTGSSLASATKFLVLALSVLYLVAAVGGLVLLEFDGTANLVLWLGFLCAGAVLMVLGQLGAPPGGRSAAMISVGAVLGGLPLFWTIVVPIAVAAVITCSIALARRPATA